MVDKQSSIGKRCSIQLDAEIVASELEDEVVIDKGTRVTHSFLVYEKWGLGGHSNWQSASETCTIGND